MSVFLTQPNTQLPRTRSHAIQTRKGTFKAVLEDSFGTMGCVQYNILDDGSSTSEARHPSGPGLSEVFGEQLLIRHLETEGSKVVGSLDTIYIHPQAILSIPL